MSLSMSAFHSGSKWEVKAVAGGGGGQEWESGDCQAVPRLTRTQAEPRLAVIQHHGGQKKQKRRKKRNPFSYFCLCLPVSSGEKSRRARKIQQKNSLHGLEYSK